MTRNKGPRPVPASMRDQRRKEANERNEAWAKLSPSAQLASLDERGMVAKKQRARIKNLLKGKRS